MKVNALNLSVSDEPISFADVPINGWFHRMANRAVYLKINQWTAIRFPDSTSCMWNDDARVWLVSNIDIIVR